MARLLRKALPFAAAAVVAIAIILLGVSLNWGQHVIPLVAGFAALMVYAVFPPVK